MICTVIEGLFDGLYLHQLYWDVIDSIPVTPNNLANLRTFPYGFKGTHRLFGATLFNRVDLNRATSVHDKSESFFNIFDEIQNRLNVRFFLHSIHLNIQHSGCNGTTHTDSGWADDYTIMMMTNPEWKDEWGGQFQLTDDDGKTVVEEHAYVPGRIIIFPSKHPHRGLGPGPNSPYVYRSTVVWRVTKFDDWLNR